MKTIKFLTATLVASALLTNCSKKEEIPKEVIEGEVINVAIITLKPENKAFETVVLTSNDPDGNGPIPPAVTVVGDLMTNAVYNGSVELRNELEEEVEIITEEVKEKAEEHQFFYTSTGDFVTFKYADKDNNDLPVGLDFTVTTKNAGEGSISVILKHEPVKDADGVAEGDVKNAGGSTDLQVVFDGVKVKQPA